MAENAQVLADQSTPPIPLQPAAWERKPSEPTMWYERFHIYRSLGPARSITNAYRHYQINTGQVRPEQSDQIVQAPSTWYDNSGKWHWPERATAYDDHERNKLFADETLLRETIRRERIETLALLLKAAKEKLGAEGLKEAVSPAIKTAVRELREELDGYSSKTKLEVDIILKQLPPELQKLIQSAIKPNK